MWLTYGELAARLGIARASAERRALRRKWPRRPGNDGKARVGVPLSVLLEGKDGRQDNTPDDSPGVSPVNGGEELLARRLLDRVEALEAALEAKARETAEAREMLARREGELEGLRLATEHLHDEHARAVRDRDQAQRQALEAQAAAEAVRKARETAEAALTQLQSRGFLDRLLNRQP